MEEMMVRCREGVETSAKIAMRVLSMTIATKFLLRDRDEARRKFSWPRSVNHEMGTPRVD
jgi:hypothetical protein